MPAQPAAREPEEEMETEADPEVPQTNGEVEEEREGGEAEETMEESGEERDSDLEESEPEEEEEEEEESSEMDDEDCERRRLQCIDEMSDLEKQFLELKDKLFQERLNQVKMKLDEVLTGKAGEYREPLATLQQNLQQRTQVAGVYRELCLQVVRHKHECEVQGARQHLESERTLLFDAMKTELLEKIRRLEEDKQSVDITSEWWNDEVRMKKCKRRSLLIRPDRKKKAALVSGPYIVYMLRDTDILEDWTAIKKAKAALMPMKKKADNRQVPVRCEGGALFYDGEKFSKGSSVVLEVNDDSPAQAVITGISTGEVWFKRTDGTKTKIYVSQLQKGKYTIQKA
ncbi:breast cancer metastasis-suppressor 1 isoform X1 [Carassius auratus]|uniref:Breast cancer metastasis-suppressor 1-like protein-A isoform X1 n=1 Tax=Carassius auratus TaxID=7957 RepID=A0A6P6PUB0_CARAU|nr:breast cancer metastasis-suppressor 1-like protein-A isoform X1 [Carassius auratus]XP_026124490.1 breast cancer metastasis-suppressor 1-like protein-A isoform X1 [Carassius auratus]